MPRLRCRGDEWRQLAQPVPCSSRLTDADAESHQFQMGRAKAGDHVALDLFHREHGLIGELG